MPPPFLLSSRKTPLSHFLVEKHLQGLKKIQIGGQILEVSMASCLFVCLFVWALCPWFDILLPSSLCFCVALELSEMKMRVRSVAHSGRESLGALETDAKWAWGLGVACCVSQAWVPWLASGSGLQEHEKGSPEGPVELHLRLHCLWNVQCELPRLRADSSHSWPAPRSMHPGAEPALTHAPL